MIGLRLSFVCRFRSVLLPLIGLRIYRSRFMLLFVVPCSLQALRIVDFDEEALVAGFKSWFGGILCLAWSPDGRYIVTGGEVRNGYC